MTTTNTEYEVVGNGCECWVTPQHMWFRYGGAVEPGSTVEWNPDCPEHRDTTENAHMDRAGYTDPHEETRSELETAPLPLIRKARVQQDRVPNSEGWRSWIVTHPTRGTRTFYDTWDEALTAANTLAAVYGTEAA